MPSPAERIGHPQVSSLMVVPCSLANLHVRTYLSEAGMKESWCKAMTLARMCACSFITDARSLSISLQ